VSAPEGVDLVELASEQGPVESIEELVSRREMSAAVAEAMKLLPDEQRTAIVLKEYHGLTFQEIAELQGCPLSTVKTRLYQGLTVLRRQLDAGGMTRRAGRSGTSEKAS
jgi:RNA polymerase sigma-70 factor, ECF subfamily